MIYRVLHVPSSGYRPQMRRERIWPFPPAWDNVRVGSHSDLPLDFQTAEEARAYVEQICMNVDKYASEPTVVGMWLWSKAHQMGVAVRDSND